MPLSSLTADLDYMLADIGQTVTFGSGPVQTTKGFVDVEDIMVDDGNGGGLAVAGYKTTLTIRDGTLAGLAQDLPIVHNGHTYSIRDAGQTEEDGSRKLELVEP